MSQSLFPVPTVYLVDTSSLVRLDGLDNVPPSNPFSTQEQKAIWEELESLAKDGRLKLIKQVKGELKRYDPVALNRLRAYSGHSLKMNKTDPVVIRKYREVTSNHPDLMRGGSRRDHADPWLIVAAELFGYKIITEELLKGDRLPTLPLRRLKMERIPDVCQARKLEDAIHLRDLAMQLNWIT